MITLSEVTINKYKSYQTLQTIKIEDKVTVLVGMNEAGKTVLLEALAKMNYFKPDEKKFKFDIVNDYPRKELVKFQKESDDVEVVKCKYEISEELKDIIEKDLGIGVVDFSTFEHAYNYKAQNFTISNVKVSFENYVNSLLKRHSVNENNKKLIQSVTKIEEILEIGLEEDNIDDLKKEIEGIIEKKTWENKLQQHVWKNWLSPNLPKFWYFDDYYQLDGRININDLKAGMIDEEKSQTIYALLELAGIEVDDLLTAIDFENFIAQLEAASNEITDQIFKYWTGNPNLDIEFKIDKVPKEVSRQVNIKNPSHPYNTVQETVKDVTFETIIDIRVRSQSQKVTLPLHRRSKGFNWFFSFIVWFSKINSDQNSKYILLFDEPGLNLRALAQADLLKFIEDLSKNYQVIFSTHSPFMIDSNHLERVRTIVEKQEGSIASDTLQEKDPNTLFPLQVALGYSIAQNLFISKNNLLLEGPADLLYISIISNILENEKREHLNKEITIVPVGGLDKVSSFISLMRGNNLNIACFLDNFVDQKGKQRIDDLMVQKIIKSKNVRFFDEFANNGMHQADIEDLFTKEDYLKIFNEAFKGTYNIVSTGDLDSTIKTIVNQLNKYLKVDRFNHYKPAYKLAQLGADAKYFDKKTLDNFEHLFKEINKLF